MDEAIKDLNGRLDIFVANAGIPWINGSIIDSDTELFQNVIQTNFISVYFCAKAAGKHFKRQKSEGTNLAGEKLEDYNLGSFIVTSSVGGLRQLAPQASTPYSAAKAAVTHFSKCLAVEWVQFARVNIISPGYVTTEMLDNAPDLMRNPWKGRIPMG